MSYVTNVIVVVGAGDEVNADALNGRIDEFHDLRGRPGLSQVDGYAGGYKPIECSVYMCAYNYIDSKKLIEAFTSIDWFCPESAQLMIKDQNDFRFSVAASDIAASHLNQP